jgi:hypothetical protein
MAQTIGKVLSIVSLNGRRSRQTELPSHRSGGSGTGDGPRSFSEPGSCAILLQKVGLVDRSFGKCRFGPGE